MPRATGMKRRATTSNVRVPASSNRRITSPHKPPERWWIITIDMQPTATPAQKR